MDKAEREGSTGLELLNAVTLGYDLCCRFLLALGPDHVLTLTVVVR